MKYKNLIVAAALGVGVGASLIGSGAGLASYVLRIPRQSLEEALDWQREHYDISWLDEAEQVSYDIPSFDGCRLHAVLLPAEEPSKRYVILSHGYTDNRWGSLKYAKMYRDMGWNCVLWDLRGHGANEKDFCTYGLREGQDLSELVKDSYQRYGADITLGLHGESLGAATTISALQYCPELDFAVADSPFADIWNVLERQSAEPAVQWVSIWAKLRYGYALSDMRPIDALKKSQVPLLLIHGLSDDFVPPENSHQLYEAAQGEKEIWLVEGAAHAQSVFTDPEGYAEHLSRFLEKTCGPVPAG